jgi:hypothetical protein
MRFVTLADEADELLEDDEDDEDEDDEELDEFDADVLSPEPDCIVKMVSLAIVLLLPCCLLFSLTALLTAALVVFD